VLDSELVRCDYSHALKLLAGAWASNDDISAPIFTRKRAQSGHQESPVRHPRGNRISVHGPMSASDHGSASGPTIVWCQTTMEKLSKSAVGRTLRVLS
jgi:hypothetical protein